MAWQWMQPCRNSSATYGAKPHCQKMIPVKHGNYQNLLEKLRLPHTIELSEHENGKVTEMHCFRICLTGDRSASPKWSVDWVIISCMNDQRGKKS